jgi:hypothetical protein
MTDLPETTSLPKIGSRWRHRNGARYTVLLIANGATSRPDEYPVTVVYQGDANGFVWSRRADDWHRSMEACND